MVLKGILIVLLSLAALVGSHVFVWHSAVVFLRIGERHRLAALGPHACGSGLPLQPNHGHHLPRLRPRLPQAGQVRNPRLSRNRHLGPAGEDCRGLGDHRDNAQAGRAVTRIRSPDEPISSSDKTFARLAIYRHCEPRSAPTGVKQSRRHRDCREARGRRSARQVLSRLLGCRYAAGGFWYNPLFITRTSRNRKGRARPGHNTRPP